MCTGNSGTGYSGSDYSGSGFASAADALAAAEAALDFLNSPDADLPGSACGEVLVTLGRIQAKHAAARAEFLRRFDAADAHDADGYGSSSAWLAAAAQLTPKDAKAAVKEMHRHRDRPLLAGALRAGAVTQSWADEIAAWTRRLPVALRQETDRIILEAAAAGSPLDDLKVIARYAVEAWRNQGPTRMIPTPATAPSRSPRRSAALLSCTAA